MNGVGLLLHKNGDIYKGEFLAGEANGYGGYLFSNGTRYEGTWKNDV